MKMDTHVHTAESSRCGVLSAVEMVQQYARAGYGCLVITDHLWEEWRPELPPADRPDAWLAGYRAAKEEGEKQGITVLLGAEIRFSREGNEDFLTYGLREGDIPWLMDTLDAAQSFAGIAEKIRGRGLFLAQAHPFRPGLRPKDASLLDGMEIYNGNPRHDSHNDLARAQALAGNLALLSGSDAHQTPDVGRGGFVAPAIGDNRAWLAWLRAEERKDIAAFEAIAIENGRIPRGL